MMSPIIIPCVTFCHPWPAKLVSKDILLWSPERSNRPPTVRFNRSQLNVLVLATEASQILVNIRGDIESKTAFVFRHVMEQKMYRIEFDRQSSFVRLLLDAAFFPFVYTLPDTHLFMLDKVFNFWLLCSEDSKWSIRTLACCWYGTRLLDSVVSMLAFKNRPRSSELLLIRSVCYAAYWFIEIFKDATSTDLALCLLFCQILCCVWLYADNSELDINTQEKPLVIWFSGISTFFVKITILSFFRLIHITLFYSSQFSVLSIGFYDFCAAPLASFSCSQATRLPMRLT